jgi:hypothetical protein
MDPDANPSHWPRLPTPQAELIAYLAQRHLPCPRCGYDLRASSSAICPECAEPLELRVGSAKPRFGWLLFAIAPGCFSGVAAIFVSIPIAASLWNGFLPGKGLPWPIIAADIFGYTSAASVVLMYRHRATIMSWPSRRQAAFACGVWAVHIAAFFLVLLWLWFYR